MLTVDNGGTLNTGALYASLATLFGNGIISTKGAVLDAELVFDAANPVQTTVSFGSGGKLSVNPVINSVLGAGYKGTGTLEVTGGIAVSSSDGYLGYHPDSTGTATVAGAGSKWTTNSTLYVGNYGKGTLMIEAGGQVSSRSAIVGYCSGSTGTATITGAGSAWTNAGGLYVGRAGIGVLTVENGGAIATQTLYASPANLLGNGRISTQGAVLDADLVFDTTHPLQQTYFFGSGGLLTVNPSTGADMGAGYNGIGSLRIAEGSVVSSSSGYLGYFPGSIGTATVTGAGSKWVHSNVYADSGTLCVGNYGTGTLTIEAGGQVKNSYSFIGNSLGSTGTVTVAGTGSSWVSNINLYVGNIGTGKLVVRDGGTVSTMTLYASLADLSGNGTITTQGAVLDADFVFDATHPLQQTFSFGSGGVLTVNTSSGTYMGAGYKGTGSLRIADGIVVSSNVGFLGYYSNSAGTAIITGTGSQWTKIGNLYVGNYGQGMLKVEAGGLVSDVAGLVGDRAGSTGMVTVSGAGSMWTSSGGVYIGGNGSGTLRIEAEGTVAAKGLTVASYINSTGTCTIDSGGTLQVGTVRKGVGNAVYNWNDGTIRNYDAATDLSIPAGLALSLAAPGTHAFSIDLDRTGTVGAVLADTTTEGTLNKTGMGSLILTAANTYTGLTTIDQGKLIVNGSLAGAATVNSGGTLGGGGTIVGVLTVNSGGTLAPGNSPGILTVNNAVTFSAGSAFTAEVNGLAAGSGYDQLKTTGPVSLGGTLALSFGSFAPAGNDVLFLINNTGTGTTSGTFQYADNAKIGLYNGLDWYITYDANNGSTPSLNGGNDVAIYAVPEPSTLALLAMGLLGGLAWAIRRRW